MKILSAIFGLLILALVLCFALSNQQGVSLAMWPWSETVQVPLYLTGLVPLAVGLIFGGVLGWLSGVPHRFRVRGLKKELEALNDKIGDLQKNAIVQAAPDVRRKYFWERKS
ncbi:MAG: LapA family protein [Alphaproteobacteria bacterium]